MRSFHMQPLKINELHHIGSYAKALYWRYFDAVRSWATGSNGVSVAPPRIAATASRGEIIRKARRYLRQSGWTALPAAEWANIWIRVEKDGDVLNVIIKEEEIMGWRSLIEEASEGSRLLGGQIVGILSAGKVQPHIRQSATDAGCFAMEFSELQRIDEAVSSAKASNLERIRRYEDAQALLITQNVSG